MKRSILFLLTSLALLPAAKAERNYMAWHTTTADVAGDSNTTYRSVATQVDALGHVAVTGYNDLLQKDTWVTERYDALTGVRLWRKTLSSTTGEARPAAIGTDPQGNVFVGGFVDVLGQSSDFCLVKYRASDGVELWKRTYNNSNSDGSDQITALLADGSGNVAVTGFSVNNGNEDFYTILYDADGNIEWQKRHATSYLDRPVAIARAPDGDIVVAGKSRVFYLTSFCMLRYNFSDGAVVTEENYDLNDDDEATDVAVDSSGNIIVTGISRVLATGDYVVKTVHYGSNYWVATYNAPDQNLNNRNWWPRVGVDAEGNVIMACTAKLDGFKTVRHVVKYRGTSGSELWKHTTSAPAGSPSNYSMTETVYELAVDAAGNAIVTGGVYYPASGTDILTAKFSGADGRILWQQRNSGYSTAGEDQPAALALSPTGDVVVAGTIDRGDQNSYYQMSIARYNRLHLSKGDPITGTGLSPAAVVNSLSVPATKNDGSIIARITVKDGSKVLHAIADTTLGNRALVLQGQIAGQLLTPKFATFGDPVCNSSGSYSFIATMTGAASGQGTGLFTNLFTAEPQMVLQTGKQVPGMNTGILLASIVNFTQHGSLLIAHVTVKGTGVTTANNHAVLHVKGLTTAALLMRTGSDVTVFGKAAKVKSISIFSPPAGAAGHGRYVGGSFTAMNLTLSDARSVATTVNTTTLVTTFIAGSGSSAQQALSGATYQSVSLPGIAGNGGTAVAKGVLKPGTAGVTTANDSVLLSTLNISADNFKLLAREGSPAAGANGALFSALGTPISNLNSNVAFTATLKGTGVTTSNDTGIWVGSNAGNATLMVREGDISSDAFGGTTARKFASFTTIAHVGVQSYPAFRATLRGTGVTTANNSAFFAVDSDGYLRQMIRTGDKMGTLTVKSFTLLNAAAKTMNSSRSFNQNATFTALVTFTNSTQSIVTLDVP